MRGQALSHMGGTTMSTRLTEQLLEEIRRGKYAQAERLPSEMALSSEMGVSRSVIRDVLANLEREGFIERGRGVGTLIHRDVVNLRARLDVKYSYFGLIRQCGCIPSLDNLRVYEDIADEALAERFGISSGEKMLTIEKRILADKKPVIYAIDRIPMHLFQRMDYFNIDFTKSIFDLLEQWCGIDVDSELVKLSAVMGSEEIRRRLNVEEGKALIYLDEMCYYRLKHPVVQAEGYYTDFFDFTILRKKV